MKRNILGMTACVLALGLMGAETGLAMNLGEGYIESETLSVVGNNYRNQIIQGANGRVEASSLLRPEGAIVTITYEADEGYELKSIEVSNERGLLVPLMPGEGNSVQYEQPAGSVTIQGNFQRIGAEPTALDFDDVKESDWFYDYVNAVYQRGVMTGVSETSFDPQGTLTRGAVAVLITSLQKVDLEESEIDMLTDVNASSWYYKSANWCVKNGIIPVETWNEFDGDRAITREELMTSLYHVAKYTGFYTTVYEVSNLSGFADAIEISEQYLYAMSWGVRNSYLTGDTEDRLNPLGSATRAEVCVILSRFLQAHDFYVLYGWKDFG